MLNKNQSLITKRSRQQLRGLTGLLGLLFASSLVLAAGRTEFTHLDQPQPAPAFSLTDLQGKTHSLSDYQGQVLVVNFWATYCKPCLREMPSLQRTWEKLRDEGIHVVAIDVGESRDWIMKFQGLESFGFPILLDEERLATDAFGVVGIPTTYVVDPGGRIVIKAVGEYEWDSPEIAEKLRALKQS